MLLLLLLHALSVSVTVTLHEVNSTACRAPRQQACSTMQQQWYLDIISKGSSTHFQWPLWGPASDTQGPAWV